jgi:DNA-binding NarL/FixJ family response regulator
MIVDDSVRFLEVATVRLDRGGFEVVATATTSQQALDLLEHLRPDVALVDIGLGNESGLELAREIADRSDPPTVVLISTRAEADYVALIAKSPAIGFIAKSRLSVAALRGLVGSSAP